MLYRLARAGPTLHGKDEKDQAVLADIALHQILDEPNVAPVLAADVLDDARQVDEREVGDIWTGDLEDDDVARESQLFKRSEGLFDLVHRQDVVDEARSRNRGVQDRELSPADGALNEGRVSDDGTEVNFRFVAFGLVSSASRMVSYRRRRGRALSQTSQRA